MKSIPLTQGLFAMVDDDDFESLKQFKWHAERHRNIIYACRSLGRRGKQRMHSFIMRIGMVDHRDGNGLNNQKSNLRPCNHVQNGRNRKPQSTSLTGLKGVAYAKKCNKFQAMIYIDGRAKWLGYYDTPKLAAKAYDMAALKFFGEYARTNEQLGLLV